MDWTPIWQVTTVLSFGFMQDDENGAEEEEDDEDANPEDVDDEDEEDEGKSKSST